MMARKPRVHVPGGFYHVILRGNDRQDIFDSDDDRHLWESLVSRSVHRYEHRVHAYCWMTNHIHMAIQVNTEPLGGFMSFLASNYARKINLKTQRSGHLFERRYRAILIQEDSYLLELVRYIHMNPVRARMVGAPADYEWSSHHGYLGSRHADWLSITTVLGMFGADKLTACRRYARFMGNEQAESVVNLLRSGGANDDRTLGDDEWVGHVLGEAEKSVSNMSLDELVTKICARHGVAEQELASLCRTRYLATIRAEIALAAVENRVSTVSEVARRFGRSQPTMSKAMVQLKKRRQKL